MSAEVCPECIDGDAKATVDCGRCWSRLVSTHITSSDASTSAQDRDGSRFSGRWRYVRLGEHYEGRLSCPSCGRLGIAISGLWRERYRCAQCGPGRRNVDRRSAYVYATRRVNEEARKLEPGRPYWRKPE